MHQIVWKITLGHDGVNTKKCFMVIERGIFIQQHTAGDTIIGHLLQNSVSFHAHPSCTF